MTPWTAARQAPLSTGFSRQEHWRQLPCPPPGDPPDPGIEPKSPVTPARAAGSLQVVPPGKPILKKWIGIGSQLEKNHIFILEKLWNAELYTKWTQTNCNSQFLNTSYNILWGSSMTIHHFPWNWDYTVYVVYKLILLNLKKLINNKQPDSLQNVSVMVLCVCVCVCACVHVCVGDLPSGIGSRDY